MLDLETFKTVVSAAPLISIDLVIQNDQGDVLLGLRNNRPAKGMWFVPGGRILKDEKLEDAFKRLTQVEIGEQVSIAESQFIGPYEHMYIDNFSGDSFSTHYVVLAYNLLWNGVLSGLPIAQHSNYQWWTVEALMTSPMVHENTKAYFR